MVSMVDAGVALVASFARRSGSAAEEVSLPSFIQLLGRTHTPGIGQDWEQEMQKDRSQHGGSSHDSRPDEVNA